MINKFEAFKCDMCGKICSNRPYEHMNGAGETTIIEAIIFDEEHVFCDNCSNDLREFINMKRKKHNYTSSF